MLGKLTVSLFFLLLVWGNLVAGMKAGLGCPDWPLCHGRVLPPFRWDIYMEFGHRLIASLAGASLLALSYSRFKAYGGRARAVPALALVLIAAEIFIGGYVVLSGLPAQLTTVHFMVGLTVFMLVFYMARFDGRHSPARFAAGGGAGLPLTLAGVVFFQAALGSYVRHSGAGLACPDFPTCLGRLLPPVTDGRVLAHFSHRALAYLIALTMLALYAASRIEPRMRRHQGASAALLALVLAQVLAGAAVVATRLNYMAAALHLAIALAMLFVLASMWAKEAEAAAGDAGR